MLYIERCAFHGFEMANLTSGVGIQRCNKHPMVILPSTWKRYKF